jgi:hypothetical protein
MCLFDREWSQSVTPVESPPTSAYVVNSETVTDLVTGLVWERVLTANRTTWAAAQSHCENLVLSGATDWRLPTMIEMLSLVDSLRAGSAVNSAVFPDVPAVGGFWTATRHASLPTHRWAVYSNGKTGYWYADYLAGNTNDSFGYRCVR